jgi:CRP-like cAMP-binding protein
MSIEDDIAFLERVPTLGLLGRDALRILAIGAESRYLHDGDVLFTQSEPADAGYVVQEGLLSLDPVPGRAEPIAVGPGTLLGELAMLTETTRPVTAIALEPSTVIRIPRTLFLKMLEGYPEAALRLRESFVARAEHSESDMHRVRRVLEPSHGQT